VFLLLYHDKSWKDSFFLDAAFVLAKIQTKLVIIVNVHTLQIIFQDDSSVIKLYQGAIFEVWAIGSTISQFLESLKSFTTNSTFLSFVDNENETFKLCLETSVHAKNSYKKELVQNCLDILTKKWKLKMVSSKHNPTHTFWIIDYLQSKTSHQKSDTISNIKYQSDMNKLQSDVHCSSVCQCSEEDCATELRNANFICFCRQLTFTSRREVINTLKQQPFLGPTSTDPEIALIMANQTLVNEFSFVFDPFVGTGTLLSACGLLCQKTPFLFGCDVDEKLLIGHGEQQRTSTNFTYFSLMSSELLLADSMSLCFREPQHFFDAIICDPPFGLRTHLKQQQNVSDIIDVKTVIWKLLLQSAALLKLHGRLVFLCPSSFGNEIEIPQHPSFELLSVFPINLRKQWSRLLFVLKKTSHLKETEMKPKLWKFSIHIPKNKKTNSLIFHENCLSFLQHDSLKEFRKLSMMQRR
jgi:tRNA G10  N-methylase Trm11